MRPCVTRAPRQRALRFVTPTALAALAVMSSIAIAQSPSGEPPAPLPAWAQPQRSGGPTPPPRSSGPQLASPVIARVEGRDITQADFDRVALPYLRQIREQLGPGFSGEVQKLANRNVLGELIRRELLAVEVQRQNIQVTQSEVDAVLMEDPFFQTNGDFDSPKFNDFKTNPKSNYLQVLPHIRELAAIRKLNESLRKRFTPTPAQVRAEWVKRNEQVRFMVLLLRTHDMSPEPEATEADWARYYAAHPDEFMRRTRVRLRYLRLPLPPEGDSTRAAEETKALARASGLADSLRRRAVPDTAAELVDSGLFDISAPFVPGLGRIAPLADTLSKLDQDPSIRVVGPYPARNAIVVGVVAERQPKHLPPLREVVADVKRRADAETRRLAEERKEHAFYEQHLDRWRTTRASVTRVALNAATMPAGAIDKIVAGLRTARDVRSLARGLGAVADTLTLTRDSGPDSVFSAGIVDSLLASAVTRVGTVYGPRSLHRYSVAWRIDAADSSFVPSFEAARARVAQAFVADRATATEAEARAYFEQHRAQYRTPVKYAVDYVAIPVPPADSVRIPEATLRRQYDATPERFRTEEQVQARHILIRPTGPGGDADQKARARADSLLAAIRKDGGDFADWASRFSQDPAAAVDKGELGWFGRDRMVKPFENAAFALGIGEISPVVKTQFGYHIIKLEGRRPAGTRPYAEVRDAIRLELARGRADSLARRAATALRGRLALGAAPKVLASSPYRLVSAAPISATDPLPDLGIAPELAPDLPAMAPGKWARKVYRAGERYLVVRLREVVPPRAAEFSDVTRQATDDMKTSQSREVLNRKVAELSAGLAAGASLDSLAAPYGGLKDSALLSENADFVPMVGNEPRLVKKAFAMKRGEISDTLEVAQGVAWIRVEEKKSGDPAAFKAAAAKIETELLKQQYDAWSAEREKTVHIQILRPDLKEPTPPMSRMTPPTAR